MVFSCSIAVCIYLYGEFLYAVILSSEANYLFEFTLQVMLILSVVGLIPVYFASNSTMYIVQPC